MALTLRIKTSSEAAPIELSGFIHITTGIGQALRISGDIGKNKITLTDNKPSYLDWYNTQVSNKRLAIERGGSSGSGSSGSSIEEGQPSFQYHFVRGKDAYIYGDLSTPYLASIQSGAPDEHGNIQILPGKTVDVSAGDGKIYLSKLVTGILNDPGVIYREINVFLWYLYHALNVQAYRLHIFAPPQAGTPAFTKSHLMGTIPSYQALLAKWNYLVWKRSFIAKVNEADETLNFSFGYSGVSCTPTEVAVKVQLILKDDKEAYDSTIKFFTMYAQGMNTSLDTPPSYTITKYGSYPGTSEDSVNVDGHGTDDWAGEKTWKMIEIAVPEVSLAQGEYYNAAFSLAVALNEGTTYFYQNVGNDQFTFDLNIVWVVRTGDSTMSYPQTYNNLNVKTILLYEEEEPTHP